MWMKSLHLYRVHEVPEFALSDEALGEALEEQAFRPLGSVEARRLGWTTPAGRASQLRVHRINGHRLLTAFRQERLLPAGVIKEELEKRAADREKDEGRPLRRMERQALKEQIYEEFLPRAFVRTSRLDVWWDLDRHLIAVNTASRKRAEDVLDLLRVTLGSLKVTPLATKATPARAMTEWLTNPESRPAWLALGDQVELKAVSGDQSVLRGRLVDLDGEEIQTALDTGRQVTKLAFTVDERVSLVMNDELSLRSMRFADALLDEASQADDGDDPVLRLETDFALMSQALRDAVELLIEALGGEATLYQAPPGQAVPALSEDLGV